MTEYQRGRLAGLADAYLEANRREEERKKAGQQGREGGGGGGTGQATIRLPAELKAKMKSLTL